ncbi:hypothetical protein GCM10027185_48650 [Spirosoma pulveris]
MILGNKVTFGAVNRLYFEYVCCNTSAIYFTCIIITSYLYGNGRKLFKKNSIPRDNPGQTKAGF